MKTEFKGSEGKWGCVFTSDKKRAVRNKGGLICTLYHPSKYSGQDERYDAELEQMRADQRLIANAPEILKALEDLVMFCKENNIGAELEFAENVIKETLT
jgi:hypothetical protein